eukprot:gene10057-biopygen12023
MLDFARQQQLSMLWQQRTLLRSSNAGQAPQPRRLNSCVHAAAAQQGLQAHGPWKVVKAGDLPAVECLKEWAVTCAALQSGQQTILLRKGGIREPTFTPKARQFFMFPTAFHTQQQLLKPGIAEQYQPAMQLEPKQLLELPLTCFAEVTGAWTTQDAAVLTALDPLHVYAEGFLDTRLKWRAKEPLTLLELRCFQLQQPLVIPTRPEYFGCFSWVTLLPEDAEGLSEASSLAAPASTAAAVAGDEGTTARGQVEGSEGGSWKMQAALSDEQFKQRQHILRKQLAELQCHQLPCC